MQLYFLPLACSLATRISLYEAGADATYVEVDPKTKLTRDGMDFREVNPLGLVPTIRTDEGDILTENAAILQHVAESFPKANLAPTDRKGRTQLQQWLCFIGTELHKALFNPLLDNRAPEGVRAYALEKGKSRLDHVEKHLTGREFLLDRFSVADAYLVTVLNWCVATPIDLDRWPALRAYVTRLSERPSVAKALAEERTLYMEELARHRASA
ncbi:glutathione S-transferase C-terminal domain-containing protein [Pyxidicoccus xibeiensis]|uniref:glutathione S-transferase C-terminal domain-containing protein n=1 Tax=Pyxidicoccus xibeiensis TaxID=2906759 RepID=UPI0020A81455|nr:glutathione S-transferase C-terminal domain-containing protein [Pyxidicoccus xibeiensis]MCP3140978.1 glutathione S-transferase C-terminal domain-containing protein [Pyxidicoccus xibeiensis]